jgi:hypothetical protein
VLLFLSLPAFAQSGPFPPGGQPTLNQASQFVADTPSDTTILVPTRGLFIGNSTACNIAVVGAQGISPSAVTLSNVNAGQILPFSVVKVMATNTTCTGIVLLY